MVLFNMQHHHWTHCTTKKLRFVCLYVYSSDHYVYTKNTNMELKNVPRWYFSFMMMVVFQFTTSSLNTCNDVFMINTNMILNILPTCCFLISLDGIFWIPKSSSQKCNDAYYEKYQHDIFLFSWWYLWQIPTWYLIFYQHAIL